MGKADQRKTQNAITGETDRSSKEQNAGLIDTQNAVNRTTDRSTAEHSDIYGGYKKLADDPSSGVSEDARKNLLGVVGNSYQGNSGGGGGGGGISNNGSSSQGVIGPGGRPIQGATKGSNVPDYLNTTDDYLKPSNDYTKMPNDYLKVDDSGYRGVFNDLSGKTGGFDQGRLDRITGAANKLYDTSGNYDDVNKSIGELQGARKNYGATEAAVGGLQGLGVTGGVTGDDFKNINRGTLQEFEQTGGYSDGDRANIRARSNSGIASSYANLQDDLAKRRLTGANVGPGWSEAASKLTRQGAQDTATNARNTEVDIADAVRKGRMDASSKLSDANLGLQDIKSKTSLAGYTNAGTLDTNKNTSINDAMNNAGRLGLTRQQQIDAAMESAAGIDNNTQDVINRSRAAGASGLSADDIGKMGIKSKDELSRLGLMSSDLQSKMGIASQDQLGRMGLMSSDTLGRAQIAASSANAGAGRASAEAMARMGLDADNQRFLIEQDSKARGTGLAGMSSLYGTAPAEQMAQQNLLRGYRSDASNQNQGLIAARDSASRIPGLGSTISSGLGIAGQVMGLASPVASGLSGMGKQVLPSRSTAPSFGGLQ